MNNSVKEVKAVPKTEVADKLEQGWRYITVPKEDLYNYRFEGLWLNDTHYGPGTHLVSKDVADTLEERLKVWAAQNVSLMRPNANRKALQELGNNV